MTKRGSSDEVAGARAVRDEDAFDVAAVDAWVREVSTGSTTEKALGEGLPEVRQFAGGASNLTYLLRYPERDLVLRRPPAGTKAKGAHDMGREYRIQAGLAPVFPYIAPLVGMCEDESVIGSPFYVMERLVGHIPRKELGIELDEADVRRLCTNTVDLLLDLHRVDPAAAGLDGLAKGEGYVARQVSGWIDRYRRAKTWNVPSFEKVMAWLDEQQPADSGSCLIHNDFRMDNVVYADDDPTRPIGLLDWELATIGDPLMDLGTAMSYWIGDDDPALLRFFRMQPSNAPGMLSRREVVDYYCDKAGITLTDKEWTFYEVYGLFRLAAILQQIYYRYHHKQTRNPRFRNFWVACHVIDRRCRSLIRDVS